MEATVARINVHGPLSFNRVSSAIKSGRYNQRTGTLILLMHSGHSYSFYNVPRHVVVELVTAQSSGLYFARNIARAFRFHKHGS